MTTKEKTKMFGLIFAAALMVVLAGVSVSVAFNNDATPPRRANRPRLLQLLRWPQ